MKSIMEEASSVIKAIEKGWTQAGQPKEFSIKIFEEPQKNFIGMTVKSAKIGIFFSDTPAPTKAQETGAQKRRPVKAAPAKAQEPEMQAPQEPRRERVRTASPARPARQAHAQAPQEAKEGVSENTALEGPVEAKQPVWSESMVQETMIYLKEILAFVSIKPFSIDAEPQHFYLRLQFNDPIFEDKAREKQLFVCLSTLLLQMLKHKYRRPLKGYKIVLIGHQA